MKYLGKKRMYQFLVDNGYNVPKMKEMSYEFYRGSEWLRVPYGLIDLYCPNGKDLYLSVYEYTNEEEYERREIERSHYRDGVCVYKRFA